MTTLERAIESALASLRRGEVVAIPTDTVYGLAADPRVQGATSRLFALKGRPSIVALPVLLAEPAEAASLAVVSDEARVLLEAFWPGPLTVILERRPGLDLDLGGDPTTVGLRCPGQVIARQVLAATGPLAVSSANRHGEAPATTAEAVRDQFGAAIGAVVDGGRCDGVPSTVVSLVGRPPALSIIREGPLSAEQIEAVLDQ